jgi:tRNA pseudouridine38-40 synthase
MKLLGKVIYKGTAYQGWQKQPNAPTIEATIEKVLSQILNRDISICGSGRTDAGVHARGQYFHFEVNNDTDINKLRYSTNQLLPGDIHIVSFTKVGDDFHARFSAREKHYSYTIVFGENNPFSNEFCYHFLRPINVESFISAINEFDGKHCFQDFTSKDIDEKNFFRTVRTETKKEQNTVRIDFFGDGFMKYMIRFMVGTAIAIGENREPITFISQHLNEKKQREIVRYKAPSEGLILEDVKY